ncbi:MAG TPA: hypothetical protein VIY86_12195, partial [Pirellulaceae bacterium]
RNLAAAFDAMHAHGIIVGDVNQGNLMVDAQMCVRFIDCDSFQIRTGDRVFPCPVGTPHFTPPELQAKRLVEIERTVNHDAFGLAVLIFHLLFVGRHPFAGRFRSSAEVTIEKAIGDRLFAFSKKLIGTQVDPPVASLTMDDIPTGVVALFEQAFRGTGKDGEARPAAQQWVEELDKLIKCRKVCPLDPTHVFYNKLKDCPWCRIETQGGPSHFLAFSKATASITERIHDLHETLQTLFMTPFPLLFDDKRVTLPELARRVTPDRTKHASSLDAAGYGLAVGSGLCLVGVFYPAALAVGVALSLICGGFLGFHDLPRARRREWSRKARDLKTIQRQLAGIVRGAVVDHAKREANYQEAIVRVEQKLAHLNAEGDQLEELIRQFESEGREHQRNDFLRKFPLKDQIGGILGLTKEHIKMLEMYGIDTACEAEMHMLYGIPNITNGLAMELDNWRTKVQSQFVYRPDFGTSLKDLQQRREESMLNFRYFQSQRVLVAAKEAKALTIGARDALSRALTRFDGLVAKWRGVEEQLRTIRRGQSSIEALVNRSVWVLVALSVGLPVACLAIFAIMRLTRG